MTDIKSMFHQFMVSEEHWDLLRFLWWEDGDPKKEVVEYKMKVHQLPWLCQLWAEESRR